MGRQPELLLQARRERRVELYTSTPLLAELTDILGRSKFEKKIAASLLTVDQLVDRYAELAQVVRPTPTPRIVSDPDDDVVIGTALAAKADLLVTGDRSLLLVDNYSTRLAKDANQVAGYNPTYVLPVLCSCCHYC